MLNRGVIVAGVLLLSGCASQPPALVNSNRIGVEEERNLADCKAQAERQPMRHPHPKLPAGTERRTQVATIVETCMAAKGTPEMGGR